MARGETGPPGPAPTILGMPTYPGWIDGNAGVTLEALGGLAARDWLHGRLPWWNPYSGAGLPLTAESQNAACFLPFVLLLALPNGLVWLKIAMQLIAGLAMLALLRRLGVGRRPALTGAVLAECNGSFAWLAHGPILPVPFLPLLLLGIERARGAPDRAWSAGVPTMAAAFGCSLAAGFPEVAFLNFCLAAVWALVRLSQTPGWRPAARLVLGPALGGLLAAPAVAPFLVSLPGAFVGVHNGTVEHVLPAANLALLLFPTLLGPILYGTLAYHIQTGIWFSAGGYASLVLLLLALAGLLAGGRERALRLGLGLWLALTVAAAALPGAPAIIRHIPALAHINLPTWIVPSWLIAGSILAAFALDAWERGAPGPRARRIAAAATAAAGAAVLPAAWPAVRDLLARGGQYWVFAAVGLVWTAVVAAAVAWLLTQAPSVVRRRCLHALVMLDAIVLFALPLAATAPHQFWDHGTLGFLRDRIGLGRVFSAGPMEPNYGAAFGIAELNHNYLPLPQRWVDAVRSGLMPGSDGVNFYEALPDAAARARLRANTASLEAYGVRYVLTWPGDDPYTNRLSTDVGGAPQTALPLARDASFSGTLPTEGVLPGLAGRLSVRIGTYIGQSDGALEARLCAGAVCSSGRAPLAGATDNDMLNIGLDPPLAVTPGQPLTYRLTHRDGDHQVAIWLYGRQPDLTVAVQRPGPAPVLVHRGSAADVWALPDPQPYWDAPGCTLSRQTGTSLKADCARPARLRRLELDDPGWTATVNGTAAAITTAPGPGGARLLQALDLPAGHSRIRFGYAPPGIGWAWLAFVAGLAGLAGATGGSPQCLWRQARAGAAAAVRETRLLAAALADAVRRDPAPALFAAWLLPVLLMIAVLTPPWQNSDEPTHAARIVQVAHGGLVGFRLMGTAGGPSDPAVYTALQPIVGVPMHPEARIDRRSLAASEAVRWGPGDEPLAYANTAQYPPIFYLPAAAAYWAGRVAGMTVDRTLLAMRFADAVAFTGIVWLALSRARRLRPLLAAILMLPMTLSLACAASQDSLMIACAALGVAVVDRVLWETRDATGGEIATLAALFAAVGMARPPYACLLLLLALARRRLDRTVLGAMAAAVAGVVAWCALVAIHTMVKLGGADAARQLHLILADPMVVPRVAVATAVEFTGRYWREFIGTLGWTDAPVPAAYMWFASLVLGMAAASVAAGPTRRPLTTLAAVLATVAAIFVIQYFTWTWPGQTAVTGVLGRYFIVPALALGLALPEFQLLRRKAALFALALMALVTPAVIAHTLLVRYYLSP